MNNHYVYIMASQRNGTLYVGATDNLLRRVCEHKHDLIEGFTKKYDVHALVYFEECTDRESVNKRERQIKEWHRSWKIKLIEKTNPTAVFTAGGRAIRTNPRPVFSPLLPLTRRAYFRR